MWKTDSAWYRACLCNKVVIKLYPCISHLYHYCKTQLLTIDDFAKTIAYVAQVQVDAAILDFAKAFDKLCIFYILK